MSEEEVDELEEELRSLAALRSVEEENSAVASSSVHHAHDGSRRRKPCAASPSVHHADDGSLAWRIPTSPPTASINTMTVRRSRLGNQMRRRRSRPNERQ
eukprot:8090322-Pyramimonas_sp.AAC.1